MAWLKDSMSSQKIIHIYVQLVAYVETVYSWEEKSTMWDFQSTYYLVCAALKASHIYFSWLLQPLLKVGINFIPILKMWKLKLEQLNNLSKATQWSSRVLEVRFKPKSDSKGHVFYCVCMFHHLYTYLYFIYLPINLSSILYPLSTYLSIVYLSVCLSIYPSIRIYLNK